MKDRIRELQRYLVSQECDAFFSLDPSNNAYLTGFHGTTSAVIVTRNDAAFLCDFRYTEQARQQVAVCAIHEVSGSMAQRVGEFLTQFDARQVGFDPNTLTVSQLEGIQEHCKSAFIRLTDAMTRLRMLKSTPEINRIREAAALAERVMDNLHAACRTGISERELAARLTYAFLEQGAEGNSFDPIVLFGARSSLPHGMPGENTLEPGDIVLIDMGCVLEGYCSDITRTCVFGESPGAWFDTIYETTLRAQEAALAAIRPGAFAREVDAVAREIIQDAGYGKYFGHGLGHGVGLEVHEAPRLNAQSETVLEAGMVVTVEPGIYLPGQGGVRIEDLVVITETGCERLTPSSKALKVLT